MGMDRRRVAAEVRAELARQHKTKKDLAAALDMHVDTLRVRLDGVKPFDTEELDAISSFLGIPFDEFVDRIRDAA
jgi:hypothetical protein